MSDVVKNFVYATVVTPPSPKTSGTTIILDDASNFPDPANVGQYNLVVWPNNETPTSTNAEIVRVTGKSTNTLTIIRTQESSTNISIEANYQIQLSITAKTIEDLRDPAGKVVMFAGSVSGNWLKCDGSEYNRSTYSRLFNVIGTTFGSGNGSTTFNVPDFRKRVPVGIDTGDSSFNTMGKTGGSKTFNNRHNHGDGNLKAAIGAVNNNTDTLGYDPTSPISGVQYHNGYGVSATNPGTISTINHATPVHGTTSSSQSSSQSLLQPYIAIDFYISY